MREIKFRAWIKPTAHMISVDLLKFEEGNILIEKRRADEQPPFDVETRWTITDKLDADGEHDCRLMQFTGLNDRNGKEIYEGDLVKVFDDTLLAHQREYVQRVEMANGCWRPTLMFVNGNEVEVVGNIYENAELLK